MKSEELDRLWAEAEKVMLGRRSNTERGWKTDLNPGVMLDNAESAELWAGIDLHDVARGGTRTTKRNRIAIRNKLTGSFTYYSVRTIGICLEEWRKEPRSGT